MVKSGQAQSDDNYQYLVGRFTEKKITSRYQFVFDFLSDYIEQEGYTDSVYVSQDAVDHVVVDYFVDIDRLKGFQGIEYTNPVKIYSYLSYWLLRHKPLQIIPGQHDKDLSFVNEQMVSAFLRSFLLNNPSDVPILEEQQKAIDSFVETMTYFFKYRSYSAQCIELSLLAFQAGRGYQYSVDYQK